MAQKGSLVVEFIDDESVAQVPSDWVVEDFCYWPPYKPSRLAMAIKNCEPCDESWEKVPVSIICGGISDYATARLMAKKAQETSNLESDVDAQKRKIIPKRYSSNEAISGRRTSLLPPPPKMRKTIIRSDDTASPAGSSTSNRSEGSFYPTNRQVDNIDAGPSGNTSDASDSTDGYLKTIISQNRAIMSQNRAIMSQNKLLKTLLIATMERVKTLENQPAAPVDTIKPSFLVKFQNLQFPINSVEKVKELEEILESENNFQDAVNEFALFGGSNTYDFIKRVLSTILTNDVALMYSWLGRLANQPFYKLKLAQVLICAAEKGKVAKNKKETEIAMQKWLKRAGDRKTAEKSCLT